MKQKIDKKYYCAACGAYPVVLSSDGLPMRCDCGCKAWMYHAGYADDRARERKNFLAFIHAQIKVAPKNFK